MLRELKLIFHIKSSIYKMICQKKSLAIFICCVLQNKKTEGLVTFICVTATNSHLLFCQWNSKLLFSPFLLLKCLRNQNFLYLYENERTFYLIIFGLPDLIVSALWIHKVDIFW